MKKLGHFLKHVLVFLGFSVAIILCWSLAYWITSILYPKMGIQLNDYVTQLVNFELGFLIFGTIMYTIGRIINPQRKQRDFFGTLNSALMQIAKGNFDVMVTLPSLDKKRSRKNPFGELVDNIRHMAGELSEMERMRQEFVSNVSHEIQSPLTSIGGFARALKSDTLRPEERKHYLDIIETESRRLSKVSDNLLKLTSLESDHHPFEPNHYRLDQQLRKIVLSCEPQWVQKSIEMDISLEEVTVNADEDLISQVWINLIGNAIKFSPNNGTIGVHVTRDNNDIEITISDTGIGMDENARQHIFERFYKADKSRNRSNSGSGLGLSIVKRIVYMHNGEIAVESKKDKGTEITVTLPGDT